MIPDLVGVLPSWIANAACGRPGVDPEMFFPGKGHSSQEGTRQVRNFCAHCDVQSACADYALLNQVEFGIWGGLTERARRKMLGRKAGYSQRRAQREVAS